MNKINLAKKFLKVNRILGIVSLSILGTFLLFSIIGIIVSVNALPYEVIEEELNNLTRINTNYVTDNSYVFLFLCSFSILVLLICVLPFSIASFVLTLVAEKKIPTIKSKKDATKIAIYCFISGGLGLEFAIVSGVMLCLVKDTDFVLY